jgi:hypothetical protein
VKKEQNGRGSPRRLKLIVGYNANKRRRRTTTTTTNNLKSP